MPLRGMNHAALRVKDVKRAYMFYHDTLELPIDRIIGSQSSPRIVFLQGVELSQARPDQGPAGFSHLGLVVERIEEVYEELRKKGIVFEGPVRDVRFEDEKKAVKVAFFSDPDGNRVELVEWRDL
ncbi:VOC family protein [Candidatus Bathyarchaeota archaeon]|nr:VOC family protein [Candidatus Bathyarchaeota archaeon]